ncbi:HK97 family phage prohead protease [Spirochaeta africana]|uniref:Phage prohead protease, HK97 family n=1 Tax=Spirochaeta africana (strain ATCC 700263 / DSM 8902 / Z-7692) TaxID=889378 RepID=H9UJE3_SPIAZ|nr:HK97 family phage prohead protease [Spirochaeta africana]AFG37636.1 phage prohead protease, HK97 family [Spirochaeta africana DSM 8902]
MKYYNLIKQDLELREQDDKKKIIGIIPYNSRSLPMGFREIIMPTAFNKTLGDNADVKALLNHDSSKPLARVRNGSLRLRSSDDGLIFEIDVNDQVSYQRDLYESIRSGIVNGVSFGFRVIEDDVEHKDGEVIRKLRSVDLREISVGVTFPAYESSESYVRELREELADRLPEGWQGDATSETGDQSTENTERNSNQADQEAASDGQQDSTRESMDAAKARLRLLEL